MRKKANNSHDKNNKRFINYAKYTGIAFQMGVIIFLGVWGGVKLDEMWHVKPVFTIILSLLSVIIAIYIAIKDFIKLSK